MSAGFRVLEVWMIILIMSTTVLLTLTSGCLEGDEDDEVCFSALSGRSVVDDIVEDMEGNHELVTVTGLDPGENGRARFWKFAYNNVTSGAALTSVMATVDIDGNVEIKMGEPLTKTPIRNLSIDSTSAYFATRNGLIEDEVITDSTRITVIFVYLLGERPDNRGCDWTLGLVLGSEQPVEVTARIDGNTGEAISVTITKDR
ncbi:MAG: hypothetical protein JW939_05605 [Candidatus Thermoplasmatota archaeon]|nr:hypothetical protein [Candidatus Thermoplasmatota archaeon]